MTSKKKKSRPGTPVNEKRRSSGDGLDAPAYPQALMPTLDKIVARASEEGKATIMPQSVMKKKTSLMVTELEASNVVSRHQRKRGLTQQKIASFGDKL